ARSHWPASKEIEEFDEENQDDCRFKEERAALVELLNHVVVQVFGSFQLLRNQIFVIGNADLRRRQLIEPRGKHVTQELDGVIGVLGKFCDIEEDGVQASCRAG